MNDIPPEESLIEYPSLFPIKVMGSNVEGFVDAMVAIAQRFDPAFDPARDPASLTTRPSRGNAYVSVTLTVNATSRAQLDDLYRALLAHRMVKMVL